MALIAQMGLSPAHFRSTSQRRLVATKMFSAEVDATPNRPDARRIGSMDDRPAPYSWAVGGLPLRR